MSVYTKDQRPLARKEKLIVRQLADELLVYDLDRDKAHCLNQSAAAVWNLCNGLNSPTEIAESLTLQTGQAIDEEFVWLALQQLQRDHLLTERIQNGARVSQMSRREAVRRIGLGAAIAVPIVVSITAPTPAQAATCRGAGQPCSTSAQCCSGFCKGNGTCR